MTCPGEHPRRPPRDYVEDISAVRRWRRRVPSPGRASFVTFVTATPILFAIVLFLVWRNP